MQNLATLWKQVFIWVFYRLFYESMDLSNSVFRPKYKSILFTDLSPKIFELGYMVICKNNILKTSRGDRLVQKNASDESL